ncbi:hypothetical protein BO71DRAFT_248598 [Aspergillus ellipticus CBS 707.79]|uniref:Mid2 domain-containing protein n=1 Tax=Aspergillus ellipticus CBS 707.79 TaxID=1448320 RepID=A0A319E6A4_9EURO|nr:hypothetical protein BO71DRAFT_248598 [Aspergillus ellipticus CBS 707.79]
MHASRILQSAIPILALLSQLQLSIASPLEPEDNVDEATLEKRCSNPCGYYSQLCCSSSETCSTNSDGQAECVSGGGWEYFTTTETETATFTSTWSSYISATSSAGSCNAEYGETVCGSNCCGPAYVCSDNQCIIGSTSIWATATATPPVRGTTLSTVTQTAPVTTTEGFISPVSTGGTPAVGVKASDNGGLSGGAIAGIVIGTIAGVFLLLLVCACMCCRGALDSILACLGLGGGRKRKETTYVEERRHRHSHGTSARPEQRTWFGTRPAASTAGAQKKKESGMGALATIGIILGALALCLGLKRRRDHRDEDEKTDYSYPSSYYYYSSDYYTNDGSVVTDDRRTRDTRRTRRSRTRSRR